HWLADDEPARSLDLEGILAQLDQPGTGCVMRFRKSEEPPRQSSGVPEGGAGGILGSIVKGIAGALEGIAGAREGIVEAKEGLTGDFAQRQASGGLGVIGAEVPSSRAPSKITHQPKSNRAVVMEQHDQIEQAIAALFPPPFENGKTISLDHFDDEKFQRISELLKLLGKNEWSLRPRTYAVLRMIRRVDVMSAFVVEGLYDISLPYSERTLPDSLNSAAARTKFLDLQPLVLTAKVADLENGSGGHTYFTSDASAHFERIKILGSGGFGEVDHVWSRLSMNEYARKRIPRGRSFKKDKAAIASFEQELATLKRLSHRHLVKFIGSYTDPKYVSILMSPVAESNLAEYLQVNPFPEGRTSVLRSFYGCLASALLYLHDNQIRHKDIKPANILHHNDTVLLTDFGTALDWSEVGQSTTRSRPAALSVPYCAPEVANWEKRNSSSDIWSLGCVFIEMETVVKGETIDSMHRFFQDHGTHQRFIRNNAEATRLWLERLRGHSESAAHNEPLRWIADMVRVNPFERLTARQILNRIRAVDPPGTFCGQCCAEDEEHDESSDEASIHEDEVQRLGEMKITQAHHPAVAMGPLKEDTRLPSSTENLDGSMVHSIPPGGQTTEPHQIETPTSQPSLEVVEVVPEEPAGYSAEEEEGAIQYLLEQGVDVEEPDFDATHALRSAIFNEHEAAVRLLARKGANLDELAYNGKPALFEAIRKGRVAVVRLLLAAGASATVKDYQGHNALFHAMAHGDNEILELLIQAGADVEAPALYGWTPLQWAATQNLVPLMELMLSKGARLEARTQRGETALHRAIDRKGTTAAARFLIERGADLEAEMETGARPLLLAVMVGNTAVAELLVQKGAMVNTTNKLRLTALHIAATHGNEDIIRVLIDNGANIALRNSIGELPLTLAVKNGHEKAVGLLLDKQATLRIKLERLENVLWYAIAEGRDSMARYLIERGAKIKETPRKGVEALGMAVAKGHEAVTRLILEHDVDVNEESSETGKTALLRAVELGLGEMVELLLEKGARLGTSEKAQSALHSKVMMGSSTICKLLLEKGTPVSLLSNVDVGHVLWTAAKDGWEELVEVILRDGPKLESLTHDNCDQGSVPLSLALRNRHYRIAERLVEAGANDKRLVQWELEGGALQWAAREGREGFMQMGLRHGVDLENKVGDRTILDVAAEAGHLPIVKMIIEAGGNADSVCGKLNRKPLHWAVEQGHEAMVRFLLSKGAKPTSRMSDGRTPMDEAAKLGYISIMEMLVNAGANPDAICGKLNRKPLHRASEEGHEEMVRYLLSKDVQGNSRMYDGRTPQDLAIANGHVGVATIIVNTDPRIEPDPRIERALARMGSSLTGDTLVEVSGKEGE
ncbi:MAG: hypothetical protein M1823_003469, partial [Watsoniomyces obsoletus]